MKRATHILLISVMATLPSLAVAGGKYGWFNDAPFSNDTTQKGPSTVGVDVYRSAEAADSEPNLFSDHTISLFGDYSLRGPSIDPQAENGTTSSRPFANFGVRWQHRVSGRDSLSVLAEQSKTSLTHSTITAAPDALNTRATLAWTRDLSLSGKPSITGGVFLGDESGRDDISRPLGRRYYGFTVGGEMRLLEAHRPYVSFRMERSMYDLNGTDDNFMTMLTHQTEDTSRIAAGWRWQANRDLSLQAEASYGMNLNNNNGSDLSPVERERSRVFFGTRFDFR